MQGVVVVFFDIRCSESPVFIRVLLIFHIGWFRPESRLFFRRADGFDQVKAQAYPCFIYEPDTGFFPGDVPASIFLVLKGDW
jgi:hypothetical protein